MKNKNLNSIDKSGFKVPDNYFHEFDNEILTRINEDKIDKNPYSSGFTVPKNYFDQVEHKILAGLNNNEPKKVFKLNVFSKVAVISAIAASLLLIILLKPNDDTKLQFADASTESIYEYIYGEEINAYDLAQQLKISDSTFYSDIIDFNGESLENYIYDNFETEDIIEQYNE